MTPPTGGRAPIAGRFGARALRVDGTCVGTQRAHTSDSAIGRRDDLEQYREADRNDDGLTPSPAGACIASMDDATGNSGRAAALDFANQVARAWDCHLGPRLAGIYLIGSLAHGGFSARYSDIDMALITEEPLAADELDRMRVEMQAGSAELAARLSVFWTDRHFSAGRFPPLDRIDYLDHAVALRERRHVRPPRPTLPEIRAYLAAAPFENWSQEVERLSALEDLTSTDHKRYLRALLYPARFLYSWLTGKIASNDDAVAFLRHHADVGVGVDLDIIERALACRNDGESPAPLFAERSKLLGLLDSCKRVMAAEPLL